MSLDPRDHGFDGYFTERDFYLNVLMLLAGWPGKIGKRMPPGFVNPHFVYFNGADGWLNLHQYTFAQVMNEVETATVEKLTEKLRLFCDGKKHSMFHFSGLKQQPDHLITFLKSLGVEALKREIRQTFTEDRWAAHKFLYNFDTEMLRRKHEWGALLSPEGLARSVQPKYIFQCAFWRGGGFDQNIDQTEEFALYINDSAAKAEVLEACAIARKWREKTLASHEVTILDLQLWDESGTAIVEVKAPNDRLSPSQKNTIERARARGERACVIYVSEAN